MNFGTIFDLPLTMWPHKEALIYGPHRITYAALEQRTNRVANGLHALGIGPGDHVAVLVKNDHRFVETLLGALRAGATVTPTTRRAHHSTLVSSWRTRLQRCCSPHPISPTRSAPSLPPSPDCGMYS